MSLEATEGRWNCTWIFQLPCSPGAYALSARCAGSTPLLATRVTIARTADLNWTSRTAGFTFGAPDLGCPLIPASSSIFPPRSAPDADWIAPFDRPRRGLLL